VEIFGPEASGKTTLALHVIAEAQKEGGILYRELLATNALSHAYKHTPLYWCHVTLAFISKPGNRLITNLQPSSPTKNPFTKKKNS
jgi:ABC-type cobalamin/Fe3+-siderophores transport system ATPase subunit